MTTKCCSKCGETKLVGDFYKRARSADGLQAWCKCCTTLAAAEHARRNPDAARARAVRSYHNGGKETSKKWVAENRDKVREKAKRYYHNGGKHTAESWVEANKDKVAAKAKRYRAKHPEKARARENKRRAAKLRALPLWADQKVIADIYAFAQEFRSAGFDVHVDHVVPLQGKSVCGLHVPINLRVCLAQNNLKKYNKFNEAIHPA